MSSYEGDERQVRDRKHRHAFLRVQKNGISAQWRNHDFEALLILFP